MAEELNVKIEQPIDDVSLDDLTSDIEEIKVDDVPKEINSSVTLDEEPVKEQQAPNNVPQPNIAEPELLDSSELVIGESNIGGDYHNRIPEGEYKFAMIGDKKTRVTKNFLTIKTVDKGEETFRKKYSTQDLTYKKNFNTGELDKKVFWIQTRLEITFEESEMVSSLPNVKWFQDNYNKKKWTPSIMLISDIKQYKNMYTATTSKLYYLYCVKHNVVPGKLSFDHFCKDLVGKKVMLAETMNQKKSGEEVYRLDIVKFEEKPKKV